MQRQKEVRRLGEAQLKRWLLLDGLPQFELIL
jgi:hypothetical protein